MPPPWRDYTQELSKVKAKTLVIWGRDDRVVPFDGCLGFLWGSTFSRYVMSWKDG